MHPHVVLNGYRLSIWVDAGVCFKTTTFANEMVSYLTKSGMAFMRHPDRNNIFDEAEVSLTLPKYEGLPIRQQVSHYRDQGFQSTNGLYAGTIIVRDHANPIVVQVNEDWMKENVEWTYQDQLSLPVILDRYGVVPGILPYNLYDNEVFSWNNRTFAR